MPKQEEWQRLEALAPIIAAAESDPIAPLLREWQDARAAELRVLDGFAALEREQGPETEDGRRYEAEHVEPVQDRLMTSYRRIARTVPTTLAGLAAQLAVHANMEDAESGTRHGWAEETILVSMRDAAVRLAQAS